MFKRRPAVLVVGAGPVGLFAAWELQRRGVSVQIVDQDWRSGAHSYALALQRQTLPLLKEAGLLEAVERVAYPVREVALYEGASQKAQARIPGQRDRDALLVLRQDVFERLLEEALARQGVKVLWNHRVSRIEPRGSSVGITMDLLEKHSTGYAVSRTEWAVARTTEMEVPWVLGADGHRSLVRRGLGIDFPELAPAEHYAVFEFETDVFDTELDLRHQMRVVLGPEASDVLWPLPGGRCRFSFQLVDSPASEGSRIKDRIGLQLGGGQFPVLEEEQLRQWIRQRAPWFSGQVGPIHWRVLVRFEHRLAGALGRDRLWLAGDAVHVTGPAGMQSMNSGLNEASQLARLFAEALDGRPIQDDLMHYQRQRLQEWRFLQGLGGGLRPDGSADPWVCQRAARILRCLPASGTDLDLLAAQLHLKVVPA